MAFLLNIFFTAVQYEHYRRSHITFAEDRVNRRILLHEQMYFFRGLLIIAHLAFVAVLVNCFRKGAPSEEEGQSQENLLDDVVL